ncbi:MAG: UMP kinase [Candidatus Micrarchaeota archaeon]|nr:UMP kinase [Candidatus Micrarchaeota archaeon]
MRQIVVLSLGGSLVNPGKPDEAYVSSIVRMLSKLPYRFGIVVGGGKAARILAERVRKRGGSEFEADEAAIEQTRRNAAFVAKIIGKEANQKIPHCFDEARRLSRKHRFVVMGGTVPGITTDSDAVLLAECLKAKRVLNLSNIDGVYSDNPIRNPEAKKFRTLSYEQMIELAGKNDMRKAGTHFVFDFLACKLIARSKIEAHFVHGKNLLDVRKAVEGKPHGGTVVR